METDQNMQESAFSDIQIQEKNVEPENRLTPNIITRNLQLGNVPRQEMRFYNHRIERAMDLLSFPQNQNGWLYTQMGRQLIEKNDVIMVMSGSTNGFVRTINNTRSIQQKIKDETNKSFFGGFLQNREK